MQTVLRQAPVNMHGITTELEKLRDTLSASLLEVTDETTAGVLSSMLLGDKSYLDDEIKDLYQVSGISHILAISGVKTQNLAIPLTRKPA